MRLYIYGCKHPRTVCLVRKYTPTNTPKGVFANSLYPYHQQIQLVLVCKMVRIAIPTVEIRNIISENYVESGTINRPLRLRNQRGKIQQRTPPCGLFIAQMYSSEHTERRRGRFIVPASQSKPIGFGMQNGINSDANSGNMQHYFVELRGYGHDKSAPTPTE